MLKHYLLTLTLAGLVYTVTPAIAQDSGANDQPPAPAGAMHDHNHGGGHFDPAKRTEMLSKQLNLTSDQQSKVLDILKSQESQMNTVKSDYSIPPAERKPKMMAIRKAADDQIRAVLDSNQQQKFDAMQARREQREQQQRNAPAPSAPPSSQ